ncbi:protein of unknown function [Ruminococcaceae bacterium BL-6]|nr:protein of unknown function [Ruminococcaceae bacterium BL-6]
MPLVKISFPINPNHQKRIDRITNISYSDRIRTKIIITKT